ncbi:MAG: carboxypeptidase regulatory-like domain-containing protein [Ignavibacteria bacterium]|nr:carboxypeptidase regulatory-like domain-containing protein [Ignavibacteria bacterium]
MVKSILYTSVLCLAVSQGLSQERATVHSYRFQDAELRAALDSMLRWYAVPLIYLERDVSGKRVTAECSACGFEEALQALIAKQGLAWKRLGGQVLIQKQSARVEPSTATFAGTLIDSLTGEWVADANVLLTSGQDSTIYRWCSTSQFGFFSLRNIKPGDYLLTIRRIGYHTVYKPVTILPGSSEVRAFPMTEQEVAHPEVTVEGRRSALTASAGISRGVYIRATASDHNQYLLEGARIHNPLHFGGVMDAFNGDALRDVQMIAGGVPPYYGGRIGGILDVSLRNGTSERFSGSAGTGMLGSDLVLEGPLFERTTFLLSGRQGYPDIFLPRYRETGAPSDLNSSELMAKVNRRLPGNQQFSLSGYFGRDTYEKAASGPNGKQLLNSLRWGNVAANLRWIGVASPSLFFFTSAAYTRYGFNIEHRFEPQGNSPSELFSSDYVIEDAALRAHAEYFYDEYHTVLAGVELVRHAMHGNISEFSSQIAAMSLDGFSPWELSVYFQDQWRLVPSVLAEYGIRATSFVAKQGSFSAVDPRFSLVATLSGDLRLYSSFSAVNQFIHPYRHSGIFLFYPSIFLYPSTEQIPPSTSLQASFGIIKNFEEDRYRLTLESYYRTTQKLHEFAFDTTQQNTNGIAGALLVGEGTAYGAEVTLDKRIGEFTGSVRYSLSWASNRFDELNNGDPFRPRFDRRHELYATLSYLLHENWTVGGVCLLSSNQFPSFAPHGVDERKILATNRADAAFESAYAEPFDLNGGRLPGFQRVELYVQHRFSSWGVPCDATLRLVNGYGLLDPFAWELNNSPDNRLRWSATFEPPPVFPLYPVVTMKVRF